MSRSPNAEVPWQAVAMELLRRLAGAPPVMSNPQLRAAGAAHLAELLDRRIDGLYFVACDPDHPRQRAYQVLRRAQVAETRQVIDELASHGVDAAVIKGIEIGARHPAAMHGSCEDVDLLIPVQDVWSLEKVLYGRGYGRFIYDDDKRAWKVLEPARVYHFQAVSYELMPFAKGIPVDDLDGAAGEEARLLTSLFRFQGGAVLAMVHFDIHHNILFDFDVAPFLARTVASSLGTGRTLCPADHLWFLIHRHYFEVAAGNNVDVRVLAPIAALVNDPGVDWELVVRNAIDRRAVAPCLYWLTFFHRLGAPAIPERALADLRPHLSHSERNWGWQLGRLFDVEEAFPGNLLAF